MIKIACIGLMAVFLALKLKSVQPEYALLTGIAACVVLFGFSVSKLEVIAYVSEFSANLCKDAGYGGIASQIEMFGKLSILVMSLPILTTLLTTIQEFMGE